jgi:hypothetical protein
MRSTYADLHSWPRQSPFDGAESLEVRIKIQYRRRAGCGQSKLRLHRPGRILVSKNSKRTRTPLRGAVGALWQTLDDITKGLAVAYYYPFSLHHHHVLGCV